MGRYETLGYGITGMFFYGAYCLVTKGVTFNWKLALGVIVFLFILETIVMFIDLHLRAKELELEERKCHIYNAKP